MRATDVDVGPEAFKVGFISCPERFKCRFQPRSEERLKVFQQELNAQAEVLANFD